MKKTYGLDLSAFHNKEEAHAYLKVALKLPEYYGHNLDALHDVLTELSDVTLHLYLANSLPENLSSFRKVITDSAKENEGFTVVIHS